ncbi:MAG: hypothetical protein Q9220_003925 [cf. Caloplaca sp. 1 TL-2023]
MGGKAFTIGPDPLSTPRMTPELYHSLLDKYLHRLTSFFERVGVPLEAPEKTSFGDLDILVSIPKDTSFHINQLATALNAKRTFASYPIYSFAVPSPDLEGSFIQLDVHICKAESFEWELFHQSHGDLWNLLGTSIRPFGLTVNDTGLHLRIPEIEASNRKRAMLFLTANPETVLDFLHLDREPFAHPFQNVEVMFNYACSSRFFQSDAYVREGLKSNDRKRMAQRDMYRRFVDDFLPTRPLTGQGRRGESAMTREGILREALTTFGLTEDFSARIKQWQKEVEERDHREGTREWRKTQASEDETYFKAWADSTGFVPSKAKKEAKAHNQ